jgi:acyl-CoA synthetase (NDP forming)
MAGNIMTELDSIFKPKSVGIIGASSREGSFGRLFLEGLIRMGFPKIYPVHPRDKEMLGLQAYPGIKEIPGEVDLAVLMTPPSETLRLVQECADKGVKGIIIFTAGFKEKGEAGRKIEQEMAAIARSKGIRVVGPNSIGVYSPSAKFCTFPQALMDNVPIESGPVGAFSHSGSFVDYLATILVCKGVKLSKVVSNGNECDLSAVDYLEYLGKDDETKIIVAYLEGIKEGKKFYQLASLVSKKKPIIVWKAGKTESGARAALAHTGSLAGSRHVWDAMFKQSGIIPVGSFDEVIECTMAFASLPLPKGNRVVIVSGQGGTGVGTSDNCVLLGLEMARLSESTKTRLMQVLPPAGATADNPADIGVAVLMGPHLYGESIKILAEDDNVDMFLIISPPSRACTQSITDAARTIGKPLVVSIFAMPELAGSEYKFLADNNIPAYSDPKKAAAVLAKMAEYARFRAKAGSDSEV